MKSVVKHPDKENRAVTKDANFAEIDTTRIFWLHHRVCYGFEKRPRWENKENCKNQVCASTPKGNALFWIALIFKVNDTQDDAESDECEQEENEQGPEEDNCVCTWIAVCEKQVKQNQNDKAHWDKQQNVMQSDKTDFEGDQRPIEWNKKGGSTV